MSSQAERDQRRIAQLRLALHRAERSGDEDRIARARRRLSEREAQAARRSRR